MDKPSTKQDSAYNSKNSYTEQNYPTAMSHMSHMTYDYNYKYKDRSHQSFFLSDSVAKSWRNYCNSDPSHSGAELHERALVSFMLGNPLKNVLIDIQTKLGEENTVQQRLRASFIEQDLGKILDSMQKIATNNGLGDYDQVKRQLRRKLEKAIEVANPPESLVKLMETCEQFV